MKKLAKIAIQRSILMFVAIAIFLLLFTNLMANPILLASFAASLFIIFGHPTSHSATARVVIGSHLIAAVVGYTLTFAPTGYFIINAALAVGIVSFFMIFFHVRHAPAAATALAFSFHLGGLSSWMTFLVALGMILALGIVRGAWHLLGKVLVEVEEEIEVAEEWWEDVEKAFKKKRKK